MGIFFFLGGGMLISNDIPDFFFFFFGGGGVTVDAGSKPTYQEKIRVPPWDMYTPWSHDKRVFTIRWP